MDLSDLAMLLDSINATELEKGDLEKAFIRSRSLEFNDDQRLLLYALYKQSTVGNFCTPEPYESDLVEHAKWTAWKSLENFPQSSAAAVCVYLVKRTQEETELAQSRSDGKGNLRFDSVGSSSSTLFKSEQISWSDNEKLFRGVVENDVSLIEEGLSSGVDLEGRNDEGLTALIAAADRGATEIVSYLLDRGASLDALDNHGEGALDYAILCDHVDVIQLLRSRGAKQQNL